MPMNWTNSWRDGATFRCPCPRVVDHCFTYSSFQMPAAVPSGSCTLIARFSKTPQGEERRPLLGHEILAARIGGEDPCQEQYRRLCCGCSSSILVSRSARACTNTESSSLGGSPLRSLRAPTGMPTPRAAMTPGEGFGGSSQRCHSRCSRWPICSSHGGRPAPCGGGG